MKEYGSYKESSIDWLSSVPQHWIPNKIKYLAKEDDSLFVDGDWIESNVIVEDGIRYITTGSVKTGHYSEQGNGHISQETFEELNCTEVFEGDLLISRLNLPIGRACIIPDLGKRIVTSVDNVIIRPDSDVNKRFLLYLFSSNDYFEHTELIARGATMQRISRGLLGNIKIILPTSKEQTQIANYLDYKTSQIDGLISKKERLIELLKEERTAIINQAVTKGLDPNVPMKDSGIEWLGEIPEHWETTRINRIIKVKDGTHDSPVSLLKGENTFPLITSKDFENGKIVFENAKHISSEDHEHIIKRSNTEKGDIIMSMIGGNIGNMVLVDTNKVFSIKNVCLFKTCDSKILAKHLYYILKSFLLKIQIDLCSRGGAQGFLSLGDLRSLIYFVLPLNEIGLIVKHLEEETSRINNTMSLINQEIELLKEYKTALISEVVTGKVDVREEIIN